MSTYFAKNIDQNKKNWYIFDAQGQTLGRLATTIADILRGKHKADYTPHVDTGDFVVVVNAEQIKLTGKKLSDKKYFDYSGFIGGWSLRPAKEVLSTRPEEVLERAVWGMLSKGVLGRAQMTKLKVYAGAEHPHKAQNPKTYTKPERKIRLAKASKGK